MIELGTRSKRCSPLPKRERPIGNNAMICVELSPIERLSMAFLVPKSAAHIQFAYYQSSLVVEYLVENYGEECISKILQDLGDGIFINIAICICLLNHCIIVVFKNY